MRTFTGNQFGAAAANIDYQTLVGAAGRMGHALIDQARFFLTADNIDRTAQNRFSGGQKVWRVACDAQRGGRHHADLLWRDILQLFRKQLQALPAALHRLSREFAVSIKSCCQPDFALDARHGLNSAGNFTHHQHMKAVRPEVDRCIE